MGKYVKDYESLNEQMKVKYEVTKETFTLSTSLGASVKVVYRVQTKLSRQHPMAIIFTTQGGRAKMRIGYVDYQDNIKTDGVYILDKMVIKWLNTVEYCVKDFKKSYPEYRKYMFI